MALSRSFLKGMGLTEEQVEAITQANAESIEGIKAQRDELKEKADKLKDVQKELDALKADTAQDDGWKDKYEKEHKDFEAFKADLEAGKVKEAKINAYKALLKESNIADKLVDLVIKANAGEIEKYELDENGNLANADDLKKIISVDYKDYISESSTQGAGTETPPATDGNPSSGLEGLTIEEYIAARKKL